MLNCSDVYITSRESCVDVGGLVELTSGVGKKERSSDTGKRRSVVASSVCRG